MFVATGGVAVSILGPIFLRAGDVASLVSPFHPISLRRYIYGHTTPENIGAYGGDDA